MAKTDTFGTSTVQRAICFEGRFGYRSFSIVHISSNDTKSVLARFPPRLSYALWRIFDNSNFKSCTCALRLFARYGDMEVVASIGKSLELFPYSNTYMYCGNGTRFPIRQR